MACDRKDRHVLAAAVPKFAPRRDATCRNTMLTATKAKTRMTRHRDTRARHRLNSCLSRARLRVVDKAGVGSICPAQRLVRTLSVAVRATGHETAPRARRYSGQRRPGKPGPAVFLQLDGYVAGWERAYCKIVASTLSGTAGEPCQSNASHPPVGIPASTPRRLAAFRGNRGTGLHRNG